MGLLLSILVFSVGVLEVVACVRHIQYGYLPDWAPRRHVLATGTSGLTKLRDRWRKKPSKSADFEDKTIKGGYDVSRSCDVYYAGECREPLDDNRLGDKCGSLCEENEDTSASNFVSTDVGEFNLRYQEFEEVLPREANISNYQRSVGHPDDIKRGHNCTEIERRSDSKVKQHPSCIENIVSEEGINLYGQIPGSQSSSPRKSKADISWPLFVPHTPVSRRPSTPTTAEEEGENSPYFGGEFLTEEHVRSTQRPLSVRSETYHSDKDINPVLRTNRDDSSKSVNRPLTVASRADEHAACPAEQPSDQMKHAGDVDLEVSSFFPEENGSTNDAVLSTSEEEKAIEECIKQKRRTSKTEYLPSHEEVAVMSQKEMTPDATFAARKEEPIRLKPAKTTSFEEAHLETFNTDPLHAHISDSPDTDAKHSSNLSGAGEKDVLGLNITEISAVSDSSAVIGKLQLTTARAQPDDTEQDTTGSWVQQVSTNDTDSPQSDIGSKKSNKTRKRLDFHIDPESSDVDILKSQFKDTESSSKSSKQDVVNITDLNDVRPLVEITATMVVDKIIDEAVANVCNRRSAYLFNDSHQKREQFLPSDDQPSDKVTEEFITGSQVCSQPVKYEISGSPSVENRNVEIDSKNTKFLERSTRELLNSEENVQENEKPSVSVLTSVGKTKGSEDGGQKLEEARTESQPSNNLVCEESNELDRTKTDKEESADHSKRPLVLPSDTESIQERKTTSEDKVQSVENSQDNVLSSHTNKVQESVRHSEFTSDYSQSSGENTQPAMSTKVEKIETNIEESSSSEDTSSSNQPESASAQGRSEKKTGSIEEVQQQSSQPAPDAFWVSGH